MPMLTRIKACFNLSNDLLSRYLDISTDMMESISSGRRDWSLDSYTSAVELLGALGEDCPMSVLNLPEPDFLPEDQRMDKLILQRIKLLESSLAKAEARLLKLQEVRSARLHGLAACHKFLITATNAQKRQWLQRRERQLTTLLLDQSLYKVYLLKVSIEGLKAQLNEWRLILNQSP